MTQIKTVRGRTIDMEALINEHQYDRALGNAQMNIRGDIIKNGKIVKTVEERRRDLGKIDLAQFQTNKSISGNDSTIFNQNSDTNNKKSFKKKENNFNTNNEE